ncbi:MAG: hypothetical protein ACE3L7_14630 [Candidatus Pristimantibacillus sp.]
MEARDFPREDIFFLSQYGQRIIGFDEIVQPYPLQKNHLLKSEAAELAQKALKLILDMVPLPFVEIHTGRTLGDPLKQLLDENGIAYRVYCDGISLGSKPNFYLDLIEEEKNIRKLKEIQREKWQVTSIIRFQTPQEASEVVSRFGNQAHLYGIEKNVEELKDLLGHYQQKRKDEKKALQQLNDIMDEEDKLGELSGFIQTRGTLSELHSHRDFESIKNKFGKSIAKFTLYLIKKNYALQMENKISEALFRTQIALIK